MRNGGGHTRVKTARGRSTSSNRWLARQLNDPYVKRAKAEGWRSRAAFKLIELDERFHFLNGVERVVDLGIAPDRIAHGDAEGRHVAVLEIERLTGIVRGGKAQEARRTEAARPPVDRA